MIKKLLFITILILTFTSCGSSKKIKSHKTSTTKTVPKKLTKVERIIAYAKQFQGVKYKWGGSTKAGMDCSGLVYEAFRAHDTHLPRISRDMAKKGKKTSLKQVKKGDLVFFKTQKRGRHKINHVGLVVKVNSKTIEFIHSTSSRGVIVSKLSEDYWSKAFVEARNIL